MMRSIHSRKTMIALAMLVAVIAVVVPTCRIVGCSMDMGGSMAWGDSHMAGFFEPCGASLSISATPSAVVPAGADTLVLVFAAALVAAIVLMQPPVKVAVIRSHSSDPPPDPDDPLGVRLTL